MEALLASSNPVVENCMRPEFIRLAPPLHIAEDEVCIVKQIFRTQYITNGYCVK